MLNFPSDPIVLAPTVNRLNNKESAESQYGGCGPCALQQNAELDSLHVHNRNNRTERVVWLATDICNI